MLENWPKDALPLSPTHSSKGGKNNLKFSKGNGKPKQTNDVPINHCRLTDLLPLGFKKIVPFCLTCINEPGPHFPLLAGQM